MIMAFLLLGIYSKGRMKDMPKDLASKMGAKSVTAEN